MNAVCPVSRQMRRTSSCSVPRVSASSAENGSSISIIFGWIESARAMPTRCFMPPDSSDGRLCSEPVRPTRSMNFCDWARTCDREIVDNDGALGGLVETGQDVEHRGLAATGMTDDAGELAAVHREPQ